MKNLRLVRDILGSEVYADSEGNEYLADYVNDRLIKLEPQRRTR
jgi:hypothetical protein